MSVKEYLKKLLLTFFVVTTCVNVAVFIIGSIFRPDQRFGYEAFLTPILFGFLSLIPSAVMFSKRELSIRALILRKVLQLLFLEVLLYVVSFSGHEQPFAASLSFIASVAIIFFVAHWIMWIINKRDAEQLSEELAQFQKERNLDT